MNDYYLRDRDLLDTLDELPNEGVAAYLDQEPALHRTYAEAPGWSQGDSRPKLADDDPAVMQAIGRCASSRLRRRLPEAAILVGGIHPQPCGWCDYPLRELVAACSWSVWVSRLVTTEWLSWSGKSGSTYVRILRSDSYENPAYAAFWALLGTERLSRVDTAIEASRV